MALVGCAAIETPSAPMRHDFSCHSYNRGKRGSFRKPRSVNPALLSKVSFFPISEWEISLSPLRNPKCADCIQTVATSARRSNFQQVLFEPLVSLCFRKWNIECRCELQRFLYTYMQSSAGSTQASKSSPTYSGKSALIEGSAHRSRK